MVDNDLPPCFCYFFRPEIKPFFNSHVQLNEDDNDNRGDITGTGDGQGGGGGSVASQYQMMQGVEYTRDRDREQQSCGLPGGADTGTTCKRFFVISIIIFFL